MNTTEQVLNQHLAAAARLNVKEVIADYDKAAILVTPEGKFEGRDNIEQFFQQLFDNFPGLEVNLLHKDIQDKNAFIVWEGKSDRHQISFATDTLRVEKGHIVYQTFAAQVNGKP